MVRKNNIKIDRVFTEHYIVAVGPLPAAWMQEPVADTPNNWVQVEKRDGKFVASVGKETFAVRMEVSIADGRILSGTIENPVKAQERDCRDAALTSCGDPRPHQILRKVEITLDR